MQTYLVQWEIHVDAASPEAAAKAAEEYQGKENSRCHTVIDEEGESHLIDLDEVGE